MDRRFVIPKYALAGAQATDTRRWFRRAKLFVKQLEGVKDTWLLGTHQNPLFNLSMLAATIDKVNGRLHKSIRAMVDGEAAITRKKVALTG